MQHRKRGEDDGRVGVDCYVNVREEPHPTLGTIKRPTDGGTLVGGRDEKCESCGAGLSLHWDVRIVEEAPRDA